MNFLANINHHPGLLYIVLRALILFLVSSLLIRYGSRRYHLKTAFDFLLIIILGGLVSRGINGTASLISTVTAVISVVIIHKCIATLTFRFKSMELFFKGSASLIIEDGVIIMKELKKYHLTEMDLFREMRTQINSDDLQKIKRAYLENNGKCSFITN